MVVLVPPRPMAISEVDAVLVDLLQKPTGPETWSKEPGELLMTADLHSDQAIRPTLVIGRLSVQTQMRNEFRRATRMDSSSSTGSVSRSARRIRPR